MDVKQRAEILRICDEMDESCRGVYPPRSPVATLIRALIAENDTLRAACDKTIGVAEQLLSLDRLVAPEPHP